MINRGATLVSHLAVLIAVMFTLTACGGGGGGSTFYDEDGSSSSSSSSSGTSSSSGSSSGGNTPTLALALFNADGEPTDTVTSASPGTLTVSIPGGDANVQVFAETAIGKLLPESGTVLTNLFGVATFQIVAGLETGTGTVTATATTSAGDLSGNLTIQVEASSLSLALFDPLGNETTTVTSSSPGTLRVTVEGGGAGVVVKTSSEIGVLSPASSLTDENGITNFQVQAGTVKGAGNITATATTSAGEVSGSLAFQVGDIGLRMGSFDENDTFIENQISIIPEGTLASGGNAQFSIVVLNDEDELVNTSEEITFTSGCIAAGQATINPATPSKTVNGRAVTTYTATGCAGTDKVTASLAGADAQALGTISVAEATANSINFISVEPTLIVLRGTGGGNRKETSEVVFTVVDGTGTPLEGATVNLSLSTTDGGLSLSETSALSNADGEVSVTVQAGDVTTVVTVLASTDKGNGLPVGTASTELVVATGVADQNSISLSAEKFIVPNAYNVDGITTSLTVQLGDQFNNRVVVGTAVVFTTELGKIEASCNTDETGACSVTWTSTNPRFPLLAGQANIKTINNTPCPDFEGQQLVPCPTDLEYTRGARSTIRAYARGEESFIDNVIANGVMDESEKDLFSNLGEVYIDYNEDRQFTPKGACFTAPNSEQCKAGAEELYTDFNTNGMYDPDGSSPMYNGYSCPVAGDGVWCSRTLVNIWDDIVITMSDDTSWAIVMVHDIGEQRFVVEETTNGDSQMVYISDQFNNAPPAGSTVNLSTDDNCEIVGQADFIVPTIYDQGAWGFSVATKPSDNSGDAGSFSVNYNPAEGAPVVKSYRCDVSI
jgi:hypothetical protein